MNWRSRRTRRGWVYRELGDLKLAEGDFKTARNLLELLVAEFPTVPRYRESLARACNSLGLIAETAGRLKDAETNSAPGASSG